MSVDEIVDLIDKNICRVIDKKVLATGGEDLLQIDDVATMDSSMVDIVLTLEDCIFRPDLKGHYGVAREIACFTGFELNQINCIDFLSIDSANGDQNNLSSCVVSVMKDDDFNKNLSIKYFSRIKLIFDEYKFKSNIDTLCVYTTLEIGVPIYSKKIQSNENTDIIEISLSTGTCNNLEISFCRKNDDYNTAKQYYNRQMLDCAISRFKYILGECISKADISISKQNVCFDMPHYFLKTTEIHRIAQCEVDSDGIIAKLQIAGFYVREIIAGEVIEVKVPIWRMLADLNDEYSFVREVIRYMQILKFCRTYSNMCVHSVSKYNVFDLCRNYLCLQLKFREVYLKVWSDEITKIPFNVDGSRKYLREYIFPQLAKIVNKEIIDEYFSVGKVFILENNKIIEENRIAFVMKIRDARSINRCICIISRIMDIGVERQSTYDNIQCLKIKFEKLDFNKINFIICEMSWNELVVYIEDRDANFIKYKFKC